MKTLIIAASGALALGGCAGSHIKPPAVCDGKHRRPANLYGSILPNLPVPLPASQQGTGQSMVIPSSGATPSAPAPATEPSPAPASSAPTAPSRSNNKRVPRSAPRTSLRDDAPSYFSC